MSAPIHPQNVIALVWDFDRTLIPGYMQDPIFKEYAVDPVQFWQEVNALPAYYKRFGVNVSPDNAYLNHMINYVAHGQMPRLTNAKLRELGSRIVFYPGLPGLFPQLQKTLSLVPDADRFELRLEHYIVSAGLRAMIEGSAIRQYVEDIWASEFIEGPAYPGFDPEATLDLDEARRPERLFPVDGITQIAVAYDNTSKTRALFEINKGSNKNSAINVNATMRPEDRRVPFENMIYIADGPSDVPAFSLIRKNKGTAYAVYDDNDPSSLEQADYLRKDGRVDHFGPADYRPESSTARWLGLRVRQIAEAIIEQRREALKKNVGAAPRHLP
ncbi:MAG: haloacid dehalogenase-like hydrolase [Holophagaceae bacterium]|nr:haloacid dehalogenase-like hydrolase [Holophagaceae bacterium]